jgi:Family of unknown function (DUF5800)
MGLGGFLPGMTTISIDDEGVDAVYEGTEFRLERELIEEATEKRYWDVTDHEILQIIERNPELTGEPRRVSDIVR